MWVRRGTQGHVAEPRGPTRAPAWRGGDTWALFVFNHNIMGYSTYKSSDYRKIIIIPLISSHIINPPPSFIFLRVGLKSKEFLNVQVTWRRERRWIGWSIDHRASIGCTHGPPIAIKARALI